MAQPGLSFLWDRLLSRTVHFLTQPMTYYFRIKGGGKGGDHHTGLATLDDFLSSDWVEMDISKRAFRWFKLYNGNLTTRRSLPIFYEDLKKKPIPEMEKIGEFLKLENINSEEKFDCMFGDHSKRFKRSSDREYDPWDFMSTVKFDQINAYVTKLNETIWNTHGIALPDNYIRERGF